MFGSSWINKERNEAASDIQRKYGEETSESIYNKVKEERGCDRISAWSSKTWSTASQEEIEILQSQQEDIVSESGKIVRKNKSVWG